MPSNFIKFLGTAGARIVVSRQMRSSGGIWLRLDDTNILIDPRPGSLVKWFSARAKLDPHDLDAIMLTHKHLLQEEIRVAASFFVPVMPWMMIRSY